MTRRRTVIREHAITRAALAAYAAGDADGLYHALDLRPWSVNPLEASTEKPPAWLPPGEVQAEEYRKARRLRARLEARLNDEGAR